MADLGVGLLAPPLPQPPVPIVWTSDVQTIYVETRGRECSYRPRGGFISMEPILASGTAQELYSALPNFDGTAKSIENKFAPEIRVRQDGFRGTFLRFAKNEPPLTRRPAGARFE